MRRRQARWHPCVFMQQIVGALFESSSPFVTSPLLSAESVSANEDNSFVIHNAEVKLTHIRSWRSESRFPSMNKTSRFDRAPQCDFFDGKRQEHLTCNSTLSNKKAQYSLQCSIKKARMQDILIELTF